ncbi:unnamed protein product [Effrenium voratum]|nr:unnamed protein product [Effrenium voratum]
MSNAFATVETRLHSWLKWLAMSAPEQRLRVPIGSQKKPATHSGYVGHEGETVKVRLHSICFSVKKALTLSALASGDVLKAFIRSECPELSKVPNNRIRLLYRGIELSDELPLESVAAPDMDLHFLVLDQESGIELAPCDVACPPELLELLQRCAQGLRENLQPTLADSGCGGTYFLHAEGKPLAVFKPKDEEAGAPQNPRGFLGRENSRHFLGAVASAQRAVREAAAYLLDRGRAQVPMTTLARCRHRSFVPMPIDGQQQVVWKLGAFQAWVENAESGENFGYSIHSIEDVHRIGILDVRIVNFDRNLGNLLVQKVGDRRQLIPIDHGCSLPDQLNFPLHDVAWACWPQSKEPFSQDTLEYIAGLDGQADAKMLAETLGLERGCLRLLELSTLWLQMAAAEGCTLYQIAAALYRTDPKTPSIIEGILSNCLMSAAASFTSDQSSGLVRSVTHCSSTVVRSLDGTKRWTSAQEDSFRRCAVDSFRHLLQKKVEPKLQSLQRSKAFVPAAVLA